MVLPTEVEQVARFTTATTAVGPNVGLVEKDLVVAVRHGAAVALPADDRALHLGRDVTP